MTTDPQNPVEPGTPVTKKAWTEAVEGETRYVRRVYPRAVSRIEAEARSSLLDPADRWRLIRCSTDLLSQFGTRTERGERITAEWGEPDANGIYEPAFTAHSTEWSRQSGFALSDEQEPKP